MQTDSNSSVLQHAAQAYAAMGWIPLPLVGKICYATNWQKSTPETWQNAFTANHADGIGLLCGRVSKLFVLDLDSPALAEQFLKDLPALAETFTVQTSKGFHFYYTINSPLVESSSFPQIDFLYTGRYVASVQSQGKTAVNSLAARSLSDFEYGDIYNWAKAITAIDGKKAVAPMAAAATSIQSSTLSVSQINQRFAEELRRYQSRNKALFFTALWARDRGANATMIQHALKGVFLRAITIGSKAESESNRLKEMQGTIASAFSKEARPVYQPATPTIKQLPDQIREVLSQKKMLYLWRTYDALLEAGFAAHDTITVKQAVTALAGIVGRDSVRAALHAFTAINRAANVQKMFGDKKVSPATPSKEGSYAVSNKDSQIQTASFCEKSRGKKPVKIKNAGRIAQTYSIPSIADLRYWLQLEKEFKHSTPLKVADLSNVKQTRQKIHAALIERKPSRYSRNFLAARLGVTVKTIKNYNSALKVKSTPQYSEQPVTWHSLKNLPNELVYGQFLADSTGKRYPALESIAISLLRRKEQVSLFTQGCNHYSFHEPITVVSQASRAVSTAYKAPKQRRLELETPKPLKAASNALKMAIEAESPEFVAAPIVATESQFSAQNYSAPSAEPVELSNIDKLRLFKQALDAVCNAHSVDTWHGIEGVREPSKPRKPQSVSSDYEKFIVLKTASEARSILRLLNSEMPKERKASKATVIELLKRYGYKAVWHMARRAYGDKSLENRTGWTLSMLKIEKGK